jgi:hypothetical protein
VREANLARLSWGWWDLQGPRAGGTSCDALRTLAGFRSGSVAFPAPSIALSVAGLTFEGFRRTRLTTASGDERPLVVFAPLQSSILSPWPDDSASSRGFRVPPHRRAPGRPLPPIRPRGRTDFGSRLPTWTSCSVLAVSHRLDGFLRPDLRAEALGPWSRGLVASRCRSWGSPRFSAPAPPHRRRCAGAPPFPRRCSYPSKNSPRLQPHRVTTAVAPLPFLLARRRARGKPVARCSRLRASALRTPTSRLCSACESVAWSHRCQCGTPYPSVGLCSPSRFLRRGSRPCLPRPRRPEAS